MTRSHIPASRQPSRVVHGWWWMLDYLYAARRQFALLSFPWRIGIPRPTPRAWRSGSASLPEVFLLPGVYEHWTFLRPLGDALSAAGHRVRVVHGLGTNRRGVAETSERLARSLSRSPAPEAGRVLVAHSKGGLIGKHLLIASGAAQAAAEHAAAGGDPADAAADAPAPITAGPLKPAPMGVLGLVTICTPFSGSSLAGLTWVPSIRAFMPTDRTIISLGRDSSVNGRIVSIFGRYDPHIPDGSALDGATNIEVGGVGHFRVLGDAATHEAVLNGITLLAR